MPRERFIYVVFWTDEDGNTVRRWRENGRDAKARLNRAKKDGAGSPCGFHRRPLDELTTHGVVCCLNQMEDMVEGSL